MAKLKLKDIREMSSDQRTEKTNELHAELARLRTMVAAGGAVESPTQIREIRKTIARLLTIEAEEKRGNEQK